MTQKTPDSGVSLVRMTPAYAKDMAALETVCFSLPWSVPMCESELRNPISRYVAALTRDTAHGQPALTGYAGMQLVLDEGCITNVAVAPCMRRRGLGRKLLLSLLEIAKAERLRFLTLEVRVSNAPAIALYKELNFTVTGRRPGYYERPREDAHLLTLRLD